jgi:hypothetical protein
MEQDIALLEREARAYSRARQSVISLAAWLEYRLGLNPIEARRAAWLLEQQNAESIAISHTIDPD